MNAALWVTVGRLLARGLDVVMLVILARLLAPADFGIIAIAMTFILLVEALFELPMMQALVRVEAATDRMFQTAFTLGLLRGLCVALILTGLAWPISVFYENTALAALVPVLALAPIARGLGSPRMVVFMKGLDFRYEFALDLASKLAALVAVVIVAVTTRSYWAIAAGTIVAPAVSTTLSYALAPLRPRLTLAEWPLFRDMVGWNSATQLVGAISWQLDRLLLGRMIDLTTFGRYAMANDLASIPQQALVQPLVRPLMAAFSHVRSPASLGKAYVEATGGVLLIGTPIFVALYTFADPIVLVALGREWGQTAALLSLMSLASLMLLPSATLPSLAMLLDRTSLVTLRVSLELAVKAPLMFLGIMQYGIWGAIAARLVSAAIAVAASMVIVRRLIGCTIVDQCMAMVWPLTAGLAMGLAMGALEELRPQIEEPIRLLIFLGGEFTVGGLVYVGAVLAMWRLRGSPSGVERHLLLRAGGLARRMTGRFGHDRSSS